MPEGEGLPPGRGPSTSRAGRPRRVAPLRDGLLAERFGDFRVLETHAAWVPVTPQAAWRAVECYRPHGVERALFGLRALPALVAGRVPPRTAPPRSSVEVFTRWGFMRLAEEPGREVVLGLVGRFWGLRGGIVRLDRPGEFAAFSTPGYAKAVMGIRVVAEGSGARVSTETRIQLLGPRAGRFEHYWRVIGPWSALLRRMALRRICRDAVAGE